MFRHDLGVVEHAPRAKAPVRVPVVLSLDEVRIVLKQLRGVPALVASLLYGVGVRLQECLELRVKDHDFDRREITVRRGKGQKDRRVMLPEVLREVLRQHLEEVRTLHQADLAAGCGRVTETGLVPHLSERVDMALTFQRLCGCNGNWSCPETGRGSLRP